MEVLPEDHPVRAELLEKLGYILKWRYDRTGDLQGSKLAIAAWRAAASIPTAQLLTRIQAASKAAQMLVVSPSATHGNDLSIACSLLYNAIYLIPLATSRSLEREDQQHILGKLTGLAAFAAAVSLQVGQSPLEALRLLELGRSVTNSQLLDYRSDISDLRDQHPTLA